MREETETSGRQIVAAHLLTGISRAELVTAARILVQDRRKKVDMKFASDGKRFCLGSDLESSRKVATESQHKPFAGVFNQEQIDILLKALERAWAIVSHTDDKPDYEAQKILALCVITEARTGEKNFIKLVNRSIVRFCEMRASKIVHKQKTAQVDTQTSKLRIR